ncbi:MAG: hypothetical protein F6K09_03310 [Merismopedia sp. SIO2A8]|nr:hypothetical protein [Merismopedia sp. SIO2A8]
MMQKMLQTKTRLIDRVTLLLLALGTGLVMPSAHSLTLTPQKTSPPTTSSNEVNEVHETNEALAQLPDFLWDLIPPDIIPDNAFLQQMSELVQLVGDRQGQYAILTAGALAHDDPALIPWLSAIQATPLANVEMNGLALGEFAQQLSVTVAQRDATVDAIARQAFFEAQQDSLTGDEAQDGQEAAIAQSLDFSELPDLRQPGPFGVERMSLGNGLAVEEAERSNETKKIRKANGLWHPTAKIQHSKSLGEVEALGNIEIDVYWPESLVLGVLTGNGLENSAGGVPVVIISHGVGGQRGHFSRLAEHLASYGFVVVVPDRGVMESALSEQEDAESEELEQETSSSRLSLSESLSALGTQVFGVMNPAEFLKRPLTISAILDELEDLNRSHPLLMGRLDLDNVGIIGHSLGGYTGLALASGKVNRRQLRRTCREGDTLALNLSLMLQCQAEALPRRTPSLHDSRIKAVMALNPIASAVLGEKQIADIEVPVMIVAGSHDAIAPLQSEQLPAFSWLTTLDKYLVTLVPGGHSSINRYNPSATPESPDSANSSDTDSAQDTSSDRVPTLAPITIGPDQVYGGPVTQALSVAFMATHLPLSPPNNIVPDRYLNATYGQFLSEQEVTLHFITDSDNL